MKLWTIACVLGCTLLVEPTEAVYKVLVLGDSVSAGNGGGSYYSIPECWRSTNNYGHVFQRLLPVSNTGESTQQFTYACSGAQTHDITTRSQQYKMVDYSIFKRKTCPSCGYSGCSVVQSSIFLGIRCRYYVTRQINNVDANTNLVILTIGANDVGFADIVQWCYFVAQETACINSFNDAKAGLSSYTTRLKNVLKEIKSKMHPNGKVVLVGYPRLQTNDAWSLSLIVPFDVRAAARDIEARGKAAQQAGVDLAIAEQNAGHDWLYFLDDVADHFYQREPTPGLDVNPNRWIKEFEGINEMEWYHPNPTGHNQLGNLLYKAYNTIIDPVGGRGRSLEESDLLEAYAGDGYVGKIGEPILFSAKGTAVPSGQEVELYEWDFDNDGMFEASSTEPDINRTYSEPYGDMVNLRVTISDGSTDETSIRVDVNEAGDVEFGRTVKPCPVDVDTGLSLIARDGAFLDCIPTRLPEGVTVDMSTSGELSAFNTVASMSLTGLLLSFATLVIAI